MSAIQSHVQIRVQLPLLEDILGHWQHQVGQDFDGYRNHCYRMIHACFALRDCSSDEQQKIIIAAAYHDLGIWTEQTVDYLPPSIAMAQHYLALRGLSAWCEEISLMIDQHHSLKPVSHPRFPLVEVFRQADLVDVSLGWVRFGLSKSYVKKLQQQFPDAGFHRRLLMLAGDWFSKHPLRAPPFLKW